MCIILEAQLNIKQVPLHETIEKNRKKKIFNVDNDTKIAPEVNRAT